MGDLLKTLPRDDQIKVLLRLLKEAAKDAASCSDRFRYVACKRAIKKHNRELKDFWDE